MTLFPLRSWETFRIVIPAARNALGADLDLGVTHGRPGEIAADVRERAAASGMLGLFTPGDVRLEWIDR